MEASRGHTEVPGFGEEQERSDITHVDIHRPTGWPGGAGGLRARGAGVPGSRSPTIATAALAVQSSWQAWRCASDAGGPLAHLGRLLQVRKR